MAALQTVPQTQSSMPAVLPVTEPSNTAIITPTVSTRSAAASVAEGTFFSMTTADTAAQTGMDDLQQQEKCLEVLCKKLLIRHVETAATMQQIPGMLFALNSTAQHQVCHSNPSNVSESHLMT